MQNGVTFWTEGGNSIGMGHVMRCINIARAIDSDNVPLQFLVNNERPVIDRLDQEAFFHVVYPMSGRHAGRLSNSVVVIDTKRDVSGHVRSLKGEGKRVVLIDNGSTDEADAIVMPTPVYGGAAGAQVFSGSSYLIIGDNFVQARRPVPAEHASPLRVLVTMGGADPFNLTELVLKGLWGVEGIEVTAVIGPAFRISPTLDEFIRRSGGRFNVVFSVKDMAPLMRDAHIAFTAVGTTVYELAYMGVPSVLIGNYETDGEDLATLENLGICKSLGFYREVEQASIEAAVVGFRDDGRMWKKMSEAARGLTDGCGASRIASLICSLAEKKN